LIKRYACTKILSSETKYFENTNHLFFLLQKGNAIYAEIPPNAIPACKPHLEEGKIVYMTKITVERAKQYYKVVDHPYMIRLNKFTLIREANSYPENFPKYTFSLTPFTSLPQYLSSKEKFLGMILFLTS
jgi:replication factor A1